MKSAIDSDMRTGFRPVLTLWSSLVLNTSNFTHLLLVENSNILQQLNGICSHSLGESKKDDAKWSGKDTLAMQFEMKFSQHPDLQTPGSVFVTLASAPQCSLNRGTSEVINWSSRVWACVGTSGFYSKHRASLNDTWDTEAGFAFRDQRFYRAA